MSKRSFYVLTGLFLFLLFTVSKFPLATALHWARAEQQGLSWRGVEGTLWFGTMSDASYKQYPVGTVRVKTYLFPMLVGRVSASLSITSPALVAEGRVSAGPGNSMRLRNTALLMDLGQYEIRDAFDVPMAGTLRLDIGKLDIVDKACKSGEFKLWTNSLIPTARRYGGNGFPLAGQGRCEAGQLILPIEGKSETEEVALQVILDGDFDYQAEVSVRSVTPDLVAALRLYGFDAKGDRLVMIQRGNLLTNP